MSVRILEGDALQVLQTLPDCSVQCCVTSPPYFGLRDYGTAKWQGGDAECPHRIPATGSTQNKGNNNREGTPFVGVCGICGAERVDGQLGLEKTPDLYVEAMVGVFSGVRRVLRDDGTLWLNVGDSYAGSWGAQSRPNGSNIKTTLEGGSMLSARQIEAHPRGTHTGSLKNTPGCKPKDLIGIPWLLAFALRADGWYLRSDIIWAKPNPMPESVTDRPTKSHEYLFLLSKSQTYYYDADAIAEPGADSSVTRLRQNIAGQEGSHRVPGKTNGTMKAVAQHKQIAMGRDLATSSLGSNEEPLWRNARSVWNVTTVGYKEAHFATFPPKLIEPCILAGSAKGQTILDPFGGAGTTGLVADRLGRDALLVELNPTYAAMARKRIAGDNPLFTDVA